MARVGFIVILAIVSAACATQPQPTVAPTNTARPASTPTEPARPTQAPAQTTAPSP